jgi:hypothetical protein
MPSAVIWFGAVSAEDPGSAETTETTGRGTVTEPRSVFDMGGCKDRRVDTRDEDGMEARIGMYEGGGGGSSVFDPCFDDGIRSSDCDS